MSKTTKILFLGTGEQAIPSLEAVLDAEYDIVRVVARAPRTADSALPEERIDSPLAKAAEARGLEVIHLDGAVSPEILQQLTDLAPDLGVVVGYMDQFPASLLDVPSLGWAKVHFSLLPKYRGQHPIRSAIASGEKKLGVSVIEITDDGLDKGGIYQQEEVEFEPGETYGDAAPRLGELAASLLLKTLKPLAGGKKPKKKKQSDRRLPSAVRFSSRHLRPPWWLPAAAVYNRLRAVSPEPGLACLINRERVRVLTGLPLEWVQTPMGESGSYLGIRAGRIAVLCGENSVFGIERVEIEGGEQLTASEFAHRIKLSVGDRIV